MIALTYANDKKMDGAGAQLHRMYGIYALSRFLGLPYVHSPLKHIGYQGLRALERNAPTVGREAKYNELFKIDSDVNPPENTIIHDMEPIDVGRIMRMAQESNENEFNLFRIQTPFPYVDEHPSIYSCVKVISPFNNNKRSVLKLAVHVRRGDLLAVDSQRMLPNSYYISTTKTIIRILEKISVNYECELYTEVPSKKFVITPSHHGINHRIPENIVIDPRMSALEDFKEIPNLKIHESGDPIDALRGMATADVLLMSRSSFSYVAAILNRRGIIIYHPFWHGPLPDWIVATESSITGATQLIRQILSAKARLAQ
jgi:hypothetical protein